MAKDDDATVATAKAAQEKENAARADAERHVEEARLHAAALDKYKQAHEALWAPATAVVNVKAIIPIVLDKATDSYAKWCGIFLTELGKYALTHHVLEDEAFPTRPA
jgi:hypothetical protein